MSAVVVHGIWGIVLLFSRAPLHTTPLGIIHAAPMLNNQYTAAATYLAASGLAAIPIFRTKLDTAFTGLLLSLPQQFLLMVSFFTAALAVVNGCYPDGYIPDKHGNPHLFIFVDQLWLSIGMICHTLSLVDWYWWSRNVEDW